MPTKRILQVTSKALLPISVLLLSTCTWPRDNSRDPISCHEKCEQEQICFQGKCVNYCNTDKDCQHALPKTHDPGKPYCHRNHRFCFEGCRDDKDCSNKLKIWHQEGTPTCDPSTHSCIAKSTDTGLFEVGVDGGSGPDLKTPDSVLWPDTNQWPDAIPWPDFKPWSDVIAHDFSQVHDSKPGSKCTTITVDGVLSDFPTSSKTKGDPKGDSKYGANCDLTTLYVVWDAFKLYIGFEYSAWNAPVLYLVDTGKKGGVSNFCPTLGYKGAFPVNVKGPEFDLMIGMWLAPDIIKQPTPHIYLLGNKTAVDITMNSGVLVSMKDKPDPKVPVHKGVTEAMVPWSTLYGLGVGKVPHGAKLKIAGVLRGAKDGDGVGDVSPNCTGTVNGKPCGSGQATVVDKFHEIVIDANNDGKPDC